MRNHKRKKLYFHSIIGASKNKHSQEGYVWQETQIPNPKVLLFWPNNSAAIKYFLTIHYLDLSRVSTIFSYHLKLKGELKRGKKI